MEFRNAHSQNYLPELQNHSRPVRCRNSSTAANNYPVVADNRRKAPRPEKTRWTERTWEYWAREYNIALESRDTSPLSLKASGRRLFVPRITPNSFLLHSWRGLGMYHSANSRN